MNVSAILVTRGDVDMQPVLDSLPAAWETLVWNNANRSVTIQTANGAGAMELKPTGVGDLAVYGRYAAIEHASHDVIYVQDDDCIVSDPQAVVDAFLACGAPYSECICIHGNAITPGCPSCDPGHAPFVVCNMPQRFRHGFYSDHYLVGFGSCFHCDAPERAFERFRPTRDDLGEFAARDMLRYTDFFYRTCDIVFTGLTPRVLVDVPYTDREFASDPGRMWTTPGHVEERQRMLNLVRKVRDAS